MKFTTCFAILILFSSLFVRGEEGVPDSSLRDLAEARGISIGAAVGPRPLQEDPPYAETLAREFSMITAENAMKIRALHPQADVYHFAPADTLVDFALAHGMTVRGHTLIWDQSLPGWLTERTWTREELVAVMRDHIQTVVAHFKGKVKVWDVVNEAVDLEQEDHFRRSLWFKTIGPDYLDLAFRFAHEADPEALLYYNDFESEGMGPKSDAVYALVKGMKERGIPLHGVGLQLHVRDEGYPEPDEVVANNRRLGQLGLETQMTEIDVRIQPPFLQDKLESQARRYEQLMRACLESPNCKAFVIWGFTDKYSWIPRFFPGYGAALIFDAEYKPKPAYFGLRETLRTFEPERTRE